MEHQPDCDHKKTFEWTLFVQGLYAMVSYVAGLICAVNRWQGLCKFMLVMGLFCSLYSLVCAVVYQRRFAPK